MVGYNHDRFSSILVYIDLLSLSRNYPAPLVGLAKFGGSLQGLQGT
jgi:hypothetical protein